MFYQTKKAQIDFVPVEAGDEDSDDLEVHFKRIMNIRFMIMRNFLNALMEQLFATKGLK